MLLDLLVVVTLQCVTLSRNKDKRLDVNATSSIYVYELENPKLINKKRSYFGIVIYSNRILECILYLCCE